MARNDYRCKKCGKIIESFGYPKWTPCEKCRIVLWEVVFTTPTQVCFNTASVLEKIDEINNGLHQEALHEAHDNPDGW